MLSLLSFTWPNYDVCSCLFQTLDNLKRHEEELSKPMSYIGNKNSSKDYDEQLVNFKETKIAATKQENQDKPVSFEDVQDEIAGEDDKSSTDSEEDESSGYESEAKIDPADRKAARKEHKKKVKEDKREARKSKIPKADKKRRKKLAKAKCTR